MKDVKQHERALLSVKLALLGTEVELHFFHLGPVAALIAAPVLLAPQLQHP